MNIKRHLPLPRTRLGWFVLWALLPVGFLMIAALAVLAMYLREEASFRDEIYLIPAGYEGPVLILYNRPEGQPPRYEGGALVYQVPISGVMLVQWNTQNSRPTYWYIDRDGIRTRIRPSSQTNCQDDAANDPIVECIMPVNVGPSLPRHSGFVITHVSKRSSAIDAYYKLLDREVP